MYPLEEAAPLVIPGWTPCWGFQLVIWQYVHMLLLKLVQLAAGVYIVVATISSAPLVGVVVTTAKRSLWGASSRLSLQSASSRRWYGPL